MPMRAYRASRDAISNSAGQASAHVAGNKWVWIGLAIIVTALSFALNWAASGRSSHWGHLGALAGMFLGILVMLKAEEGNIRGVADTDEESG